MVDCSKTENYLKEKARMTKRCGSIDCMKCPLSETNNGERCGCTNLQALHPEKAIAIVQKWSDEHEAKTYKDDFFEKFPNAPKDSDGTPKCCRDHIYNTSSDDFYTKCDECWGETIEVTN